MSARLETFLKMSRSRLYKPVAANEVQFDLPLLTRFRNKNNITKMLTNSTHYYHCAMQYHSIYSVMFINFAFVAVRRTEG
jgi:hypothetical protein